MYLALKALATSSGRRLELDRPSATDESLKRLCRDCRLQGLIGDRGRAEQQALVACLNDGFVYECVRAAIAARHERSRILVLDLGADGAQVGGRGG